MALHCHALMLHLYGLRSGQGLFVVKAHRFLSWWPLCRTRLVA